MGKKVGLELLLAFSFMLLLQLFQVLLMLLGKELLLQEVGSCFLLPFDVGLLVALRLLLGLIDALLLFLIEGRFITISIIVIDIHLEEWWR